MLFNLRLMLSAFTMIFLAELGDKTQISIFALAADRRAFLSVVVGAAVALVLSTMIAATLGGLVGRFVPVRIIKLVSAGVFLTFGVLTLVEAIKA
ncbi:MAG: TMEM165/GDT1 family protein [Spirochaetales bacterium]|nr:TMEM165/GDT1 family protein [Spirochaetales bacterium]